MSSLSLGNNTGSMAWKVVRQTWEKLNQFYEALKKISIQTWAFARGGKNGPDS